MPAFKYSLSIIMAAVLSVLSPGLGAYEAVAGQFAAAGRPAGRSAAAPAVGGLGRGASGSSLSPGRELSAVQLSGLPALPRAAVVSGGLETHVSMAPPAVVPAERAPASVSGRVAGLERQVALELGSVGDLSRAGPETARNAGLRLGSILLAAPAAAGSGDEFSPEPSALDELSGGFLARPAGEDISASAQDYFGSGETRVLRSLPEMKDQGAAPKAVRSLGARLAASGMALLPAIFIGWPLLSAGALAAGSFVVLSSALVASLPYLGAQAPLAARVAPGASVLASGALAAVSGAYAIGGLAALGGWGLMRYGRYLRAGDLSESDKVLSAFFGGLGAVVGTGLTWLAPAGWMAAAAIVLSYPAAALLLIHLPSWFGAGMAQAFGAALKGMRGLERVESSLRRDTILYPLLRLFTRERLKQSLWNGIWLSGIWIPVRISQAVQWLLALGGGLAVGALQAPVMFLWGSAHDLKPDSRAAKFFAAWAHFVFDNVQGGKKAVFNRFEAPLIPYANSDRLILSLPAAAAIRLLQWGWLVYSLAGTVVLGAVGFF
ncbi:MAG: hypothetical protein PHF00_01915, partial [Elusimicrobia bacterium]|nr:hypothetical protein [Elusimicrobiota bacterium]